MKKGFILFLIISLGIITWGLLTTKGIRASIINNAWSIAFLNDYYQNSTDSQSIALPPPFHLRGNQFRIKTALKNDNLPLAISLITPLIADPSPSIMEIYADVLYRNGDFKEAFNTWKNASNETALIKANLYFREINNTPLILATYQSLYELDPEKYTILYSEELRKQGWSADSLRILETSILSFPNSDQKSTWLRLIGDIYKLQGEWEKSEYYYKTAIQEKPDDWVAWLALGNMYYAHETNTEQAFQCFREVIKIIPERGVGYYSIGFYLNKPDTINEALSWFSLAVEKEPQNKRFLLSYANALRDTNRLEEAFSQYFLLLTQSPEDSELLYELSWAYWLNGEKGKSIDTIEKAISYNPGAIYLYMRAGEIYEKNGNFDKAIRTYEKALILDPENSQFTKKINQLRNH